MQPRSHIRFDWAMKRLLRQKANFVILEGFLSELLKEDITILEILDSESNKETEADKHNRVDILVKDKAERLIIIEIQNSYAYDYFLRILYGISKVIVEHIKEGDKYSEVKKIISINIVYFDLGHGTDYVYHGQTSFQGLHTGDVLGLSAAQQRLFNQEVIEALYPEIYLLRVNKFGDVARDSLDEWIYFLKHSEIKDEFKARGLREASGVLERANMSDSDRLSYKRFVEVLSDRASIEATIELESDMRSVVKADAIVKEVKKRIIKEKEAEKQKALQAKEQEKEAEKQKALQEKEQEKQKALQAEKKAMIINLLNLGILTDEQIAQTTQAPLEFIKQLKKEIDK